MTKRVYVVTEHPEYQLAWMFIVLAVVGTLILCISPLALFGSGIYFLYAIALPGEAPDKGAKILWSLLVMVISFVITCSAGITILYQCLSGALCQ